ncbi:hypothetical protein ACDI16_19745, partial [Oceanobacillus caeni]
VKEDVRQGIFKEADCAVYSLTVTEIQMQNMKRYIQEIEGHKEYYRYNFLGLFGFICKNPIEREKALFCSQFVASVLKECNIIDFEKPLSLIAPDEFQEVTELQLVYKGNLRAYASKEEGNKLPIPVQYIPAEL